MMNTSIPDSIDCLNLAGILPYDAKAFIKDGTQVSLTSQMNDPKKMMTGITSKDSFVKNKETPNKTKQKVCMNAKKFGTSLLAASLVFASVVLLKKKCPQFDNLTNTIDKNIKKVAQPVFEESKKAIEFVSNKIHTLFTK